MAAADSDWPNTRRDLDITLSPRSRRRIARTARRDKARRTDEGAEKAVDDIRPRRAKESLIDGFSDVNNYRLARAAVSGRGRRDRGTG